jgi:uncharacterized protein (DUF362 family)/NAD-dependent dihydropyrimidine dehydrogenase PreA subunit
VTLSSKNNQESIVSITRATNYELSELIPAVKKSLGLVGDLIAMVKPRNKVFVKINHLPPPSPPERGIVTHPVFVEAVLTLLKEIDCDITVGDDIESSDDFKISGYQEMCDRVGVKLVHLKESSFVETPVNGKVLKSVFISKIVREADVIINLPKLKTHSLITFTGGIKNLYGVIPSGLRRRFHGDYLRMEDFSQMLVDIFSVARPHLTIMDGIMAMEGEGPGSGKMRKLGLVLASRDTVALDAVATKIIGLKPEEVLTTRYAGERGLGISDLNKIQIVGEQLKDITVSDFKLPASVSRAAVDNAPRALVKYFMAQVTPRPQVCRKNCTACGECVKACPTGAMTIPDGKTAVVNDKLCISCMCCHEVCRFNAIVPNRPFIGNVVYVIVQGVRKIIGK